MTETKKLSNRAIETRKDYFRKWRGKNRDKIKDYNRKYWEKKSKSLMKEAKN